MWLYSDIQRANDIIVVVLLAKAGEKHFKPEQRVKLINPKITKKKKSKLVDMRLEEIIDKETYERKYPDLVSKQEQLVEERKKLQETSDNEKDIKKRLKEFKKTLEQNEVLDKFDRYVFESIVEKVIVGGLDENGNVDPAQLTFVYKTDLKNSVDGAKFKPQRKNARGRHRTAELCSHDSNEVGKMCSDSSNDTCGDGCNAFPQKTNAIKQVVNKKS